MKELLNVDDIVFLFSHNGVLIAIACYPTASPRLAELFKQLQIIITH